MKGLVAQQLGRDDTDADFLSSASDSATKPLMKVYYKLEEKYYEACDELQDLGVAIYDYYVNPIESLGVPSFPVTVALLAIIIASLLLIGGQLLYPKGYEVQVTVALKDGTLVNDAQVQLSSRSGVVFARDATRNGRVTFSGLPQGLFTVHGEKENLEGQTIVDPSKTRRALLLLSEKPVAATPSGDAITFLACPTPLPQPPCDEAVFNQKTCAYTLDSCQNSNFVNLQVELVDAQTKLRISGNAVIGLYNAFTQDQVSSRTTGSGITVFNGIKNGATIYFSVDADGYALIPQSEEFTAAFGSKIQLFLQKGGPRFNGVFNYFDDGGKPIKATIIATIPPSIKYLENKVPAFSHQEEFEEGTYLFTAQAAGYASASENHKVATDFSINFTLAKLAEFAGPLCTVEIDEEKTVGGSVAFSVLYVNENASATTPATYSCSGSQQTATSTPTGFNATCVFNNGSQLIEASIGGIECVPAQVTVGSGGPNCTLTAPGRIETPGAAVIEINYANATANSIVVECGNGANATASNCGGGSCSATCNYGDGQQTAIVSVSNPAFCSATIQFGAFEASLKLTVQDKKTLAPEANAIVSVFKNIGGVLVQTAGGTANGIGQITFSSLAAGDKLTVKARSASAIKKGEKMLTLAPNVNNEVVQIDFAAAVFDAKAINANGNVDATLSSTCNGVALGSCSGTPLCQLNGVAGESCRVDAVAPWHERGSTNVIPAENREGAARTLAVVTLQQCGAQGQSCCSAGTQCQASFSCIAAKCVARSSIDANAINLFTNPILAADYQAFSTQLQRAGVNAADALYAVEDDARAPGVKNCFEIDEANKIIYFKGKAEGGNCAFKAEDYRVSRLTLNLVALDEKTSTVGNIPINLFIENLPAEEIASTTPRTLRGPANQQLFYAVNQKVFSAESSEGTLGNGATAFATKTSKTMQLNGVQQNIGYQLSSSSLWQEKSPLSAGTINYCAPGDLDCCSKGWCTQTAVYQAASSLLQKAISVGRKTVFTTKPDGRDNALLKMFPQKEFSYSIAVQVQEGILLPNNIATECASPGPCLIENGAASYSAGGGEGNQPDYNKQLQGAEPIVQNNPLCPGASLLGYLHSDGSRLVAAQAPNLLSGNQLFKQQAQSSNRIRQTSPIASAFWVGPIASGSDDVPDYATVSSKSVHNFDASGAFAETTRVFAANPSSKLYDKNGVQTTIDKSLVLLAIGSGGEKDYLKDVPAPVGSRLKPGVFQISVTSKDGVTWRIRNKPLFTPQGVDCTQIPTPPTHTVCNNQQCELVAGAGNSQCASPADCTNAHAECAGNACVAVEGSGPSTCQTDSQCTGTPTSHTICSNNACTVVSGSGPNQCASPAECANKHAACVNNACAVVSGSGASTCQSDNQCQPTTPQPPATHSICSNNQCVQVSGSGTNQCSSASDCSGKHAACVNGACAVVSGSGADTCQTNEQCKPTDPKTPPATHSVCQNNACVQVSGEGNNQCSTNSQCANRHAACVNNACALVEGSGASTCQTNEQCKPKDPKDPDPTGPGEPETLGAFHAACSNGACIVVAGPGSDQCSTAAQCSGKHAACANGACTLANGAGASSCQSNDQCKKTDDPECTGNSDCKNPRNPYCSNGKCQSDECYANSQCPANMFCSDGNCELRDCDSDSQCPGGTCEANGYCSRDPDDIPTHAACQSNQCVQVEGVGAGQCGRSDDCSGVHAACVNKACVVVTGSGTDSCQSDSQCQTTEKHSACVNNACVPVSGSGDDQCSAAADCSGKHAACVGNACTLVEGSGPSTCQTNEQCKSPAIHSACVNGACAQVSGEGTNQCSSNAQCSGKHAACVNNACTLVDGAGASSCQSNDQCKPTNCAAPPKCPFPQSWRNAGTKPNGCPFYVCTNPWCWDPVGYCEDGSQAKVVGKNENNCPIFECQNPDEPEECSDDNECGSGSTCEEPTPEPTIAPSSTPVATPACKKAPTCGIGQPIITAIDPNTQCPIYSCSVTCPNPTCPAGQTLVSVKYNCPVGQLTCDGPGNRNCPVAVCG